MKVKFLKPGAGFGFGVKPGAVQEVTKEKAEELISAGIAEEVKQVKKVGKKKVETRS